jgi:hemolysin activation/secretion protein
LKKSLPYLSKKGEPLETRFLAFFDVADTAARRRFATDTPRPTLAGAGVGVRMSLGTHFSMMADYGWQLTDLPYAVEDHSRAHIKATLAF